MKPLLERLYGFVSPTYVNVERSGQSYHETEMVTKRALKQYLRHYRRLETANQTAKLLRDYIDRTLRRYQDYCIRERIGGHYRQVGLKSNDTVDFEHVIPAKVIRDLLIQQRITVDEAINSPTCILKRSKHNKINKTNAKTTPDPYWFWQRYQTLGIQIETHDGTVVDMATWNLDRHYQYFKVL
jgi:hypothetical protein